MIGLLLASALVTSAAYTCPQTRTVDLLACAEGKFRDADARLNAQWKSMAHPAELQKAQRDWLAYRDSMCEAENPASPDGSLYAVSKYLCWAELTDEQTKRLHQIAAR